MAQLRAPELDGSFAHQLLKDMRLPYESFQTPSTYGENSLSKTLADFPFNNFPNPIKGFKNRGENNKGLEKRNDLYVCIVVKNRNCLKNRNPTEQ